MCVDLQGETHTFRLLLLVFFSLFFFRKINKTTRVVVKKSSWVFLTQNFIFQFIYKKYKQNLIKHSYNIYKSIFQLKTLLN